MKILHISNYYHPCIGGIEEVARDCVHALEGAEQRLICFNKEKNTVTEEIEGIPVTRAGMFAKVSSQQLSFSFGKLLKREFKAFQPDIVVFHFPNPFEAHFLLKMLRKKKNRGRKLILWWHLDVTKQKLLGKLFHGQTMRLLRRAERVVATSPNYIDGSKYLSQFRDKCIVIPNCAAEAVLDEEIQRRAREIRELNDGKTLLFALGRHVPYKGIEYLVRASKLLGDDYAVFIGGEGPLTESLKNLAEGDKKVCFLGRISNAEKRAYLAACDIFCFPSITKNEAFGIALAEAMAYKKPVVTFTIEGSGVNYVSLNGKTGIEVPNGNVGEYAAAIEKLKQNAALRAEYGEAARRRYESLFTKESFYKNTRALIEEIVEPGE